MKGVAIDRQNGVAGLQAGLLCRRAGNHLIHSDGALNILQEETVLAQNIVIPVGFGGQAQTQRQNPAIASTVTGMVWLALFKFTLR